MFSVEIPTVKLRTTYMPIASSYTVPTPVLYA
nr:MAG TPA: hypothetical protein [Caudoviricetes sp.]